MNRKTCIIFACLFSQASFAAQRSLSCSFQGLKKNESAVDLGSATKPINPKYDFDIEIPKTENKGWSGITETLKVSGSTGTPKKGWFGLAFSSSQKPNDGWACVKLVKGQELILTRLSGEQTIQAQCTVK